VAVDSTDILRDTATLLEHSLIQSREWFDGSTRFSMLETIREFGSEQLDAHLETDATRRRHAEHVLRVFSDTADVVQPRRLAEWLRLATAEDENLQLALEWAVNHDPATALRLALSVMWF
jgi:predicted ATPase